jgi:hypothetical protein
MAQILSPPPDLVGSLSSTRASIDEIAQSRLDFGFNDANFSPRALRIRPLGQRPNFDLPR